MKSSKLYLSTVDDSAGVLAKKYGLGLELAEFCTAWNLDDCFPETDRRIQEESRGISRLTIHGPYNELYPCAIDRKARALAKERYLQTIEVAKRYDVRKIVFHGGFDPHLYFPIWFKEQSILFFRDFVKEIPEDMTIYLENVLEPEPGLLTEILQAVDDPRLFMCLDVGHAEAYSEHPALDWLRQAAPFIRHLHVHNNNGKVDSHSPLMEGIIPMEALFETIDTLCPQATVTLELPDAASSIAWMTEHHILEEEL